MLVAYAVMDISKEAAKVAAEKITLKVTESTSKIIEASASTKGPFIVQNAANMPIMTTMSYESYTNALINQYFANSVDISTSATFAEKVAFLQKNFTKGFESNFSNPIDKFAVQEQYKYFENMKFYK